MNRDTSGDGEGWNARAETFSGPIASQKDPYVELIYKVVKPNRDSTTILDIGCGTGRFSLAFANDSKKILGFDISDVMIDIANDRPETKNHPDAKFITADWNTQDALDIGKYNVTIAHMTPAICSRDTMDKMLSLSEGWCFLSGHISRGDEIWNKLNVIAGKNQGVESNKLLYAMDYLWSKGMEPEIMYSTSHRSRTMPLEYAQTFFVEAAKTRPGFNEGVESEIKEMLLSMSNDGQVVMDSNPTSAMLYWHI